MDTAPFEVGLLLLSRLAMPLRKVKDRKLQILAFFGFRNFRT